MILQNKIKTVSAFAGCLLPFAANAAGQQSSKPNVILVLVDDMGWSDFGCYGSEIHTPTIDSLALNGLRYRQFYNAARSSPSRCSILTGLYTQQAALNPGASLPNLRNDNNVTIAELLGSNGYRTYLSGKWHLGPVSAQRDPISRGFMHAYGVGANAAGDNVKNYWDISQYGLVSENNEVIWDNYQGKRFHQTDATGDYAVKFIDHNTQKGDGKPFFLYLAFNAAHWPVQGPAEIADKYTDVADSNPGDVDYFNYEVGWDSARNYRFERQKQLGVINDSYTLSPRGNAFNSSQPVQIPAWNTLDEKRRNDLARRMAVYAASVNQIDNNVKKVVDCLKANNQLENTMIIIVSDNGGNYENQVFGNPEARNAEDLATMGQANDPATFPRVDVGGGWANVNNTPFRLFKHFTHEGGIRTPGIIFYPAGITKPGTWVEQPSHLIDVMATVVDVTGSPYPQTFKSHPVLPLEGVSLKPEFTGGRIPDRQIFIEHENNRALYDGDYKLVSKNFSLVDGTSPANQIELYNMKTDPTELHNIAAENPEIVARMVTDWNKKATEVGVPAARLIQLNTDSAPGLKFRFSFDDKLTDESSNNYTLAAGPNAVAKYDEGRYGKALLLNGTSDYFDLNVTGILNPANDALTACAWVYNTQTPEQRSAAGSGIDEEQVIHQLDGRVVLHHIVNASESNIGSWVGGAQYKSPVANCFTLNQWQHIAVVSDPLAMTNTFFLNGEQLGDPVQITTAFTSSDGGFRIGAHKTASSSFWHGKLDEVCLFKGTLNAAQIVKVLNNDFNITGMHGVSEVGGVNVFPNPAKDVVWFENIGEVERVVLMTIDGREVTVAGKTNQLSLNGLAPGNYLLKFQYPDTGNVFRKIMVTQ